jgi:hypothetical protein
MKGGLILISLLMCASCAHTPRCGNPDGAKVILYSDESCIVRIRQVTIGTEMKIPGSLKDTNFANFRLEWIEPKMDSGKIELGHFVLVQNSEGAK